MQKTAKIKRILKAKRHLKIRKKVIGTANRPRLSVFRSLNNIYAQLIDDSKGVTLASASDIKTKPAGKAKKGEGERSAKIASAYEVGKAIALQAAAKKIEEVVYDRGGFQYHGRIKALAEGARDGGLKF
jgi:large subunit ribosomal protein L18